MREWWRRQLGPNLPLWVAFWVWVAMIAGVTGRVLLAPPQSNSVVPIYQAAGQRWLAGEPLYSDIPGLDIYRNPPGFAALFAPLSLFEAKTAAILWRLGCLALYALGVHRLVREVLPPLNNWRRCGVWVAAAVFMIPAFNNGQTNLILTATAVMGVNATANGRWWVAAIWLAVCGYLKLYSFAIGLLACVQFPKALSWRLGVTTAVVFALPFACQHPGYVLDRHTEFVEATRADDRSAASHSRAPRDWTIIPYDLTGNPVPRLVSMAVSLIAAGGCAWVVWSQRQTLPGAVVTPLSLGLIWTTLFGPSTEVNTYSVLAPVIGVFAFGLPNLDRWSKWLTWVGTAGLLAVEIRAGSSGTEFDLSWGQPLGTAAVTWAVLRWAFGRSTSGSGTGGI